MRLSSAAGSADWPPRSGSARAVIGAAALDAVIDYARDHLARYKCPSKVIFVDELPRNTHGKLVRRILDDTLRVGA